MIAVVVGVALGAAAPAFASFYQAQFRSYTQNGVHYDNTSQIDDYTGSKRSTAIVTYDGTGTLPAGYMGASARAYLNGLGVLCYQGMYQYNASGEYSVDAYFTIPAHCPTAASYYSQGQTAAINGAGGGYTLFYTFATNALFIS